jgi:hypothetical protein
LVQSPATASTASARTPQSLCWSAGTNETSSPNTPLSPGD